MPANFRLMTAIGLLTALGCGGGNPAPTGESPRERHTARDHMNALVELFKNYQADTRKAPTRAADFDRFRAGAPFTVAAVHKNEVVVLWGAMLGPGGKAGQTILAYAKDVPTAGGWVLFQDGTVKEITAADFQAAPKAGKT